MAGLTKAQRAEKEAAKAEEVVPTEEFVEVQPIEVKEVKPKKYRYEFNSYEEYFAYKGEKG